jgi:peptidyl-prolyl cis-trans isomerase A (cyclophilin A)
MKNLKILFISLIFSLLFAVTSTPNIESGTYALFKTSLGDVLCELYPEKAPLTVKNFIGLATGKKSWRSPDTGEFVENKPLYSNTIFHRVIPNFMIQGGDPLGNGRGGPGYRFEDEFTEELKHDRPGRLSMANSGPNTNGSQFFITHRPTPWLDGKHTIFGQVIKGQEIVDKIGQVARDRYDRPIEPVKLKEIIISK